MGGLSRVVVVGIAFAGGCKRSEPAPAQHDAPRVTQARDAAIDALVVDAFEPLPAVAVEVPTTAAALQAWLVAAHYKRWAHESKPHESDGPHGYGVRTYVSPSLVTSLETKAAEHPRGAAAVKELYDATGKQMGWAVSVKVADKGARGKGWYWYEVFSTQAGAKAAYEGRGLRLCRECHREGGSDQVLIPFPLL